MMLLNVIIIIIIIIQLANSKAANSGHCDYDHNIPSNVFIICMVDPEGLSYSPFYSVFQNSTK